ncbi:MAG: hypothetical protein HW404_274, partial [Anaerolineales bacterium]|nr:hypothetical protein [Anaerolineales bacterium]MBM2842437.1 hypothetical protein [Anaerolineales bacterium]
FDDYARPDLHLAPETFDPSEIPDLEFAMTITRANGDIGFFAGAPTALRIQVDGATLALVRDLR